VYITEIIVSYKIEKYKLETVL